MTVLANQFKSFLFSLLFLHFKILNDYYKQYAVSSVVTTKMNTCLQGTYSLMVYYLRRHEYPLVINKMPTVFSKLIDAWFSGSPTKIRHPNTEFYFISTVNTPITALIAPCLTLRTTFQLVSLSPIHYINCWQHLSGQYPPCNFPN